MNRFLAFFSRFLVLLVIAALLASCDLSLTQPTELAAELPLKQAGAWIDAPLNGAQAPPSIPIKVIGHVDPSVGQAHLYINGANSGLPSAPILNKKPPAYEWQWQPTTPGVYFLRVGGASGPLSTTVKVTIGGEMPSPAAFWADETTLRPGECTTLHWTTENAQDVQLDDTQVEPEGEMEICPQEDQTYVLLVAYEDETEEELEVDIIVTVETLTPTLTETATPTVTRTIPPAATTAVPTPTSTPTQTEVPDTPTPTITLTPSDTTPPLAPSGLYPCGDQKNPTFVNSPVNLSWKPVKDASGISQYRISIFNFSNKQTNDYYTTNTSYSLKIAEATYAWKVSAQDGAGNWGPFTQECYFYYEIVR